jgi:hypothetical protein
MTLGRYARPTLFIYFETKIRAFNANYLLPPTDMATHHDRRGNNTGVSCHFLPPIPGWEVISVTVLTLPRTVSSATALEEGYDKVRTPRSRGFGLIRLTSTWP